MMRMKKITALVFCLWCSVNVAQAATGWCTPDKATKDFSFSLNSTITSIADNQAGISKPRIYNWNLGGVVQSTCDCAALTQGNTFFKTEIPNLAFDRTLNGLNYYAINKYLSVASELYIAGNAKVYAATPFIDFDNQVSNYCAVSAGYATGSQGYVSLYFMRPFVGQVVIPPTIILNAYGTKIRGSYSATPMTSVIMSGTVTVPQSCNINAGQVINIDFGKLQGKDIKTKGATADGFIPRNVDLTLACNNISDGIRISLSINGQASSGEPTALATSNKDIGIRILNATGEIISPNTGELPVNMNYSTQTGTSSMSVTPMNVTGEKPLVGQFTATATIKVEMQ